MAVFPYYIKFAFILVRHKRGMKLFINKCENSNRNLICSASTEMVLGFERLL
jgi:hypothetical protein